MGSQVSSRNGFYFAALASRVQQPPAPELVAPDSGYDPASNPHARQVEVLKASRCPTLTHRMQSA